MNEARQARTDGRGRYKQNPFLIHDDILVGFASVMCRSHENDLLRFIDFEKKAPRTDAVSPCFRFEVFEFFNIWPEVRMLAQLGIYN